jgi:predicted ABC-type ATPase
MKSRSRLGDKNPMKSKLLVVAGPNGVGKTAFVKEYLEAYPCPYVSADVIAEDMRPESVQDVRLKAGRIFLQSVSSQIREATTFVVESTLSGLTFRNVLKEDRNAGYEIGIVFVFLVSSDACVARIRERVRKGGHPVPDEDVHRRFSRSIRNFWSTYRGLADHWHLFYNGGIQFHEVASGEGDSIEIRDEGLFSIFLNFAEESSNE